LKGQTDRLAVRLGNGAVSDLLQREPTTSQLLSRRTSDVPSYRSATP